MRKVLISSFDMEVGGVERSLVSLLSNFDYFDNEFTKKGLIVFGDSNE